MKKLITILTAIVFIVTVPASAVLAPDIGGDPIYTQVDDFAGSQTDWGLTAYSYVFDSTSSSLPNLNVSLASDEMLFVYLLDSDDTKIVSMSRFSVGNPYLATINNVGYEDDVVPQGYDKADHQKPYLYGYSGPSGETFYAYPGNFLDPDRGSDPYSLDPDEWSLVYYRAVAPDWSLVSATVSGGGESDNGFLPGPVPEPATIFILGLGALALLRTRRP